MTHCDNFESTDDLPSYCRNCRHHVSAHQTAPAVDSDDGPEQSGAPLPPQGAPLQNASPWPLHKACDHFAPSTYNCMTCGHTGPDHWFPKNPNGGTLAGATSGSVADAEGSTTLAPAPAAPVPHGAASPSGAAEDHPGPDGLAAEGWHRAIELTGHVARLTGVLELMLDDDAKGYMRPDTIAMARDAIAKAQEAIQ